MLESHPPIPINTFGGVPARRREEPIAIQDIISKRLRAQRISEFKRFCDVKNAFPSLGHDGLNEITNNFTHFFVQRAIQQLYTLHFCIISTTDGYITVHLELGVPPGSSIAMQLFNWGYQYALAVYVQRTLPDTLMLYVKSVVTGQHISLAHTLFVDDLGSSFPPRINRFVPSIARSASATLDESLEIAKVVQNRLKGESLAKLFGLEANIVMNVISGIPAIGLVHDARYLGPFFNWQGSLKAEIQKRIDAANKAWFSYRRLGRRVAI